MSTLSERISRRALLKGGGAAAVALSFPGAALARVKSRRHRLYSHLRRSSYKPLVGQTFGLQGLPHSLRLRAVQDLNRTQAGSEDAFALIFWARPGAARLAHAVPTLYHPRLGTFRLLLSPGMPSSAGQPYAAIINRLPA